MNENDIKMYILPKWSIITLTVIYLCVIVLTIIICALFFGEFWWLIFVTLSLCVIGIIVLKKDFLSPILINSTRVKRGKCEYLWKDVRITVCQSGTAGFNILLGTEYATNERAIKSAYKKHFYALLNKENLDVLFRYTKHKIKLVNGYGEEIDALFGHRKMLEKIIDFNATIDK